MILQINRECVVYGSIKHQKGSFYCYKLDIVVLSKKNPIYNFILFDCYFSTSCEHSSCSLHCVKKFMMNGPIEILQSCLE